MAPLVQPQSQYQAQTPHLEPRQSSPGNNACPDSISGGAIAGIVIGTIAGTLLILWLLRLCTLPGAWGGGRPDYRYGYVGEAALGSFGAGTRRRRRSTAYVEKSKADRGSVRRPAKVYLS